MSRRKEEIKAKSRQNMEAIRQREKRNKMWFQIAAIGLAILLVALVAFVIVSSNKPSSSPRNMDGTGVRLESNLTPQNRASVESFDDIKVTPLNKDGRVDIRVYQDYFCPGCAAFDAQYMDYISGLVSSGDATLEIHPIAILDRLSVGSKYSTRSANAAFCVADATPDAFFDYNELLFDNQPSEGTKGLDNDRLKEMATQVGVSGDNLASVESCIDGRTFHNWVENSTKKATGEPLPFTDQPLQVTPSVIVNGVLFNESLGEFSAYVDSLISAK